MSKNSPPQNEHWYYCKICEKQFAGERSVRAHIQSSTNGDHEGVGFNQADPLIGNCDPQENPDTGDTLERIRAKCGSNERVVRIVDELDMTERELLDELKYHMFSDRVKTFTHGDYRMVKITD